MNEDAFNTSLRGFLKKVGITSQIVQNAVAASHFKGNEAACQGRADDRRRLSATITGDIELG
jgi:hypothetical protein